jgi:ribosomal protein S17E
MDNMKWFRQIIFMVFVGHGFISLAQSPHYSMQIVVDSLHHTCQVVTEIAFPSQAGLLPDTAWFHVVPNAFTGNATPFADEQWMNKSEEFYFRKDAEFAEIKDLKITHDGVGLNYFFADNSHELLGVLTDKKPKIKISYTLSLPKLINGLGYHEGDFYFTNFYPKWLISKQNFEHQRINSTNNYGSFDFDVSIEGLNEYETISNGEITNFGKKIQINLQRATDFYVFFLKKHKNQYTGQFASDKKLVPYLILIPNKRHQNKLNEYIPQVAEKLTKLFGPYQWSKLHLIFTKHALHGYHGAGMTISASEIYNSNVLLTSIIYDMTAQWIKGLSPEVSKDHHQWDKSIIAYYSQRVKSDILHDLHKEPTYLSHQRSVYNYNVENKDVDLAFSDNQNSLTQELEISKRVAYFQYFESVIGKTNLDLALLNSLKSGKPLIETLFEANPQLRENKLSPSLLLGFIDNNLNKDHLRLRKLFFDQELTAKALYFAAFPAYNDNDGVMPGIMVTNSTFNNPQKWSFAISPMYSITNNKLLGQAWLNYNIFRKEGNISRISLRSGIKSFDFDKNYSKLYTKRYVRFDPAVTFHFRQEGTVKSQLALKTYFIMEDDAIFNNSTFIGLKSIKSTIYKLEYQNSDENLLRSNALKINVEYQKYGSENYMKVTGVSNHSLKYSIKKSLYVRIFASGFIFNSQRQSGSYQNVFTKGSIALIHQGFNDYLYDEYFFGRQNQSRLQDDQISLTNGGGFKTPIGSGFALGMSNNFAASANFSGDVPFRLPSWLPLRLYYDAGIYSTFDRDNNKFQNNIMTNGGISVHLKDIFTFHLPLFYSNSLKNIYTGVQSSFLSRISFSMNLNKLDFWNENVSLENYKIKTK